MGSSAPWGSFKPQLTKDGIKILVQVEVHVNIGEMQQYIDIRKDPGLWVSIERRLTQVVKNEIMAAVTKAQLFGADIFGFGAEINRRHPKKWRRLRENWEGRIQTFDGGSGGQGQDQTGRTSD